MHTCAHMHDVQAHTAHGTRPTHTSHMHTHAHASPAHKPGTCTRMHTPTHSYALTCQRAIGRLECCIRLVAQQARKLMARGQDVVQQHQIGLGRRGTSEVDLGHTQ